ncbi:MAG: ferrous iron transport protein A [Chloroflexi bacterium]|nr:ferrous iron transport protein A [Chloroflexota bacterium]
MVLIDVEQKVWVKIVGMQGGKHLRDKLTQHGLYPNDCVRVLRAAPLGGPLLVEVNGREIALGRGVAQKIIVEKTECELP